MPRGFGGVATGLERAVGRDEHVVSDADDGAAGVPMRFAEGVELFEINVGGRTV
jgi:hypothetical protein